MEQFPERKILLNPGPATTSDRVKRSQLVSDICPREHEFGVVMHDICTGLLKVGRGTQTHEVALFGASGTGAMEATLISAIAQSDHLLIITNGAYGIRMKAICENYQIRTTTICEFGDYPDLNEVEEALKANRFTHLAWVHHETSTGMMNPLEELAALCKKYNVISIVDAMSSFGAYPIDLENMGVNYVFSSSNKCIQGMAGLSYVMFGRELKDQLKINGRGFYLDVFKQWENLQKKDQLRFTPPVQVCYAFLEAIRELEEEGLDSRWSRYQKNWQILFDGFKGIGFVPFLEDGFQSKILLALKTNSLVDFNFDHFHDFMYDHGITIYPGVIPESDTFRIAVIGDLYEEDMEKVVAVATTYFS